MHNHNPNNRECHFSTVQYLIADHPRLCWVSKYLSLQIAKLCHWHIWYNQYCTVLLQLTVILWYLATRVVDRWLIGVYFWETKEQVIGETLLWHLVFRQPPRAASLRWWHGPVWGRWSYHHVNRRPVWGRWSCHHVNHGRRWKAVSDPQAKRTEGLDRWWWRRWWRWYKRCPTAAYRLDPSW